MESPDGDNIELHHLEGHAGAPRVLLLHGLEGSVRSHYVGGILQQASLRGWSATLLVFRGCGAVPNVARRFYHSGETTDLDFVFRLLSARWPGTTWFVTGVSLGGNVMLKWLGELASDTPRGIAGAVAISVPYDLEAGARHISRGAARIYDWSFLRSLRRKALTKLARYPDLFDRDALERARHVIEFDDIVTAPVHGFRDAHDYYSLSSSIGFLPGIRVPTLLLSAEDDPFLPQGVLDRVKAIARQNAALSVLFVEGGGHVGFVGGRSPLRPEYFAERRAFRFFEEMMERDRRDDYDWDSLSERSTT